MDGWVFVEAVSNPSISLPTPLQVTQRDGSVKLVDDTMHAERLAARGALQLCNILVLCCCLCVRLLE